MVFPGWKTVHFLLLMNRMVWVTTAVGISRKMQTETCGLPVMEEALVNLMVKTSLFSQLNKVY